LIDQVREYAERLGLSQQEAQLPQR